MNQSAFERTPHNSVKAQTLLEIKISCYLLEGLEYYPGAKQYSKSFVHISSVISGRTLVRYFVPILQMWTLRLAEGSPLLKACTQGRSEGQCHPRVTPLAAALAARQRESWKCVALHVTQKEICVLFYVLKTYVFV